VSAAKEYLIDNIFELHITTVVMHFCSINQPQRWNQEQLPKVNHKTCNIRVKVSATKRFCSNTTSPPPSAAIILTVEKLIDLAQQGITVRLAAFIWFVLKTV
jgi:hypothetical protein